MKNKTEFSVCLSLTFISNSLSHTGVTKYKMPSLAPGSCTLLMSRANRMKYGNKAVKYTTCITQTGKKTKGSVCGLLSSLCVLDTIKYTERECQLSRERVLMGTTHYYHHCYKTFCRKIAIILTFPVDLIPLNKHKYTIIQERRR